MNGIFISFEGIDGAGKSNHIESLRQAFAARGRQITLSREPGGTPLAEQLRNLVLNLPMDALTEALLVFAARRDHIQQVIRPALNRGEVVLCDRFTDATFAYQGGGRGYDLNILSQLEVWVQQESGKLLQPDLTIWFDVPPQVAAKRLLNARSPDRFESQSEAFFERVAGAYQQRFEAQPERFARINADQPPDQVWSDLLLALQNRRLLP